MLLTYLQELKSYWRVLKKIKIYYMGLLTKLSKRQGREPLRLHCSMLACSLMLAWFYLLSNNVFIS